MSVNIRPGLMLSNSLRLVWITFLTMIISSCAFRTEVETPLAFPADLNQPFLTLERNLGQTDIVLHGFWQHLKYKITGQQQIHVITRPSAVAIAENGDVYVVDADAARILKYEYADGQLVGFESFGAGTLIAPQGIALLNNMIFVSDTESKLIYQFDEAFHLQTTMNLEDVQRPGQLKTKPGAHEIYVVDTPGHQIVSINAQGQILSRLTNETLGRQIFKAPLSIDFTPAGDLVVLDGLTRRVEFISAENKYLSGFGGYDRVPGSFSYPRGLAISSDGYVFVSDAAFGNIQIFDSKGALLYFWGQNGQRAGEFLLPGALTFDNNDNLYVVDQYNNRVPVYHYLVQGK